MPQELGRLTRRVRGVAPTIKCLNTQKHIFDTIVPDDDGVSAQNFDSALGRQPGYDKRGKPILNLRPSIGLCKLFLLRCSRSEEHTSELQSLMRISYAVFC